MKKIYKGMENGTEAIDENFIELEESLAKSGKVFYSGASFVSETQSYNIDINEIKDSLIFIFARYNKSNDSSDGWGYYAYSIPKNEIITAGGKGYTFPLTWSNSTAVKYIKIYSNKIVGTTENKKNGSDVWILERLYAN